MGANRLELIAPSCIAAISPQLHQASTRGAITLIPYDDALMRHTLPEAESNCADALHLHRLEFGPPNFLVMHAAQLDSRHSGAWFRPPQTGRNRMVDAHWVLCFKLKQNRDIMPLEAMHTRYL